MKKGDKCFSKDIQNILCPFTDYYCTQDYNDTPSHMGSLANDVRGIKCGVRYPYYAPVDVRCVNINRKYAFTWWQSLEKVRFADGTIDYVTFLFGHDNIINCYIGQVVHQGVQIGNMGNAGLADGVHCHIEVGRGKQNTWIQNKEGVYCIPEQVKLEDVFFIDNTNVLKSSLKWKLLNTIDRTKSTNNCKYLNLNSNVSSWRVYPLNVLPIKGNECGFLNPEKNNGLSYTLCEQKNDKVVVINTENFGKVQIYIGKDVSANYSITSTPIYTLIR